jgi:hypothetical protein
VQEERCAASVAVRATHGPFRRILTHDTRTHTDALNVCQRHSGLMRRRRVRLGLRRGLTGLAGVVDAVMKGAGNVTACSRSPSQPVVCNLPPGARSERLAESIGPATGH